MSASFSSPRLLIVEDDGDTRDILATILREEGYEVFLAASPKEAMTLLEQQVFHFVLTDLFASAPDELLRSVAPLRAQAQPTPVGLLTGWKVSAEEVRRGGFACLIRKPFDLDDLLEAIAACLRIPLSPEQQRQAETVERFFASLNARDWDAALDVCTDDLAYYPAPESLYMPTRRLRGRAAYRTYIEDIFQRVAVTRFDDLLISARPKGLAARYTYGLTLPGGVPEQRAGASLFHFTGALISQIGVKVRRGRIRKVLEQQRLALSASPYE